MLYLKNKTIILKHAIIIPIISLLALPILILDLLIEIYHRTCFPLCGIPYVSRRKHIRIWDRGKLQYLTFWQKLYCMYCGYGNGVIQYWREIANITEKYWCGIRHQNVAGFAEPEHQKTFAAYDEPEDFLEKYKNH